MYLFYFFLNNSPVEREQGILLSCNLHLETVKRILSSSRVSQLLPNFLCAVAQNSPSLSLFKGSNPSSKNFHFIKIVLFVFFYITICYWFESLFNLTDVQAQRNNSSLNLIQVDPKLNET